LSTTDTTTTTDTTSATITTITTIMYFLVWLGDFLTNFFETNWETSVYGLWAVRLQSFSGNTLVRLGLLKTFF